MFNLYERKIEPFNEYSSTAAGSHGNIHRAKARTRPYAALIQEVFSQTLINIKNLPVEWVPDGRMLLE